MKLIQITDTHLVPPGEQLWGLDPRERLAAAVAHVNAHHADAEWCVLSGDLANKGEVGAYGVLREILGTLRLPYRLMMGNHDNRGNLLAVFPDAPRDGHGFVQCAIENGAGTFLLLDTNEPGANWGSYCERRLGWLEAELQRAAGRPVYLFMHHPPFDIGIPSLDTMTMRDHAPFGELIGRHPDVRHIFFGHVHRPVAGSWRGVPVSAFRGTNHQVPLDFETVDHVPKNHDAPAYGVIFIEPEQTIVHFHDYLNETERVV
jgi:3',5'-cyclic AMP phosphodiesterase CpdA